LLHQVGDLFELNVKLRCQKFNWKGHQLLCTAKIVNYWILNQRTRLETVYSNWTGFACSHFFTNRCVMWRNKLPDWKREIATKRHLDSPVAILSRLREREDLLKLLAAVGML